jgi:hypothetical protein
MFTRILLVLASVDQKFSLANFSFNLSSFFGGSNGQNGTIAGSDGLELLIVADSDDVPSEATGVAVAVACYLIL